MHVTSLHEAAKRRRTAEQRRAQLFPEIFKPVEAEPPKPKKQETQVVSHSAYYGACIQRL